MEKRVLEEVDPRTGRDAESQRLRVLIPITIPLGYGAPRDDQKIDGWSLGCLLAELLVGVALFRGKTVAQVSRRCSGRKVSALDDQPP